MLRPRKGESEYRPPSRTVLPDWSIGGFAAIGYPAEYGTTGVKTFVVNQDGVVYEKDLAAGTKSAGNTLKSYNPDKTWMEAPQEDMQLGATAPKP